MDPILVAGALSYGLLFCGLVGGAAIAWDRPLSFLLVLIGVGLAFLSFVLLRVPAVRGRLWLIVLILLDAGSWLCPIAGAVLLCF